MARTRKKLDVSEDEILDPPAQAAAPANLPVEKKKGLSENEFHSLVSLLAQDATNYVQEEVSVLRAQATDYYKGRLPDVDEDDAQEDRSHATTSDVRDTVLGMMPDLLRILASPDSIVEYQAVPDEDPTTYPAREAQAKQATSYVKNVVLRLDNPDHFMTWYAAFQDALVRKTGFVTWDWEKSKLPSYSSHTGLSEEEALVLAQDPDVTVLGKSVEYPESAAPAMPGAPPSPPAPPLYDLKIRRVESRGRVRLKAVPCENVRVSRGAWSVGDATLFGYVEEKKLGDFEAMGYSAADLKDCDQDPDDRNSIEEQARQPHRGATAKEVEPVHDESQRPVHYGCFYVRADRDGDGIPELNRVITAGTKYKVLDAEPVDEAPFAAFCPYPEGFAFFGDSVADLTMDVQRIKSRILRDTLDSLAQSVIPQTSVLEGAVNLDDVLNPDTSRVIRTRTIGAVQPHVIPFVGKEALPVLELMDNVREQRTGISDAAVGLDPKTLQSTDKDAVNATLSRAQSRIEMVARIFAETGMRRVFTGIAKLLVKHQDKPRMMAFQGQLVPVNPKDWQENMHVDVTPPRGPVQQQVAFLTAVAQKQEQILQELGYENPLVTIYQYRYTLAKILELGGGWNADSFFLDPSKMDPNALKAQLQQMQQAKQAAQNPQPAGPDPKIEMAKIQARQQEKQAELATQLHIEQLRLEAEFHLEAMRLAASGKTQLTLEEMRAHAKQASDHVKAATDVVVAKIRENGNTERHVKTLENQPKEPTGADNQS